MKSAVAEYATLFILRLSISTPDQRLFFKICDCACDSKIRLKVIEWLASDRWWAKHKLKKHNHCFAMIISVLRFENWRQKSTCTNLRIYRRIKMFCTELRKQGSYTSVSNLVPLHEDTHCCHTLKGRHHRILIIRVPILLKPVFCKIWRKFGVNVICHEIPELKYILYNVTGKDVRVLW